MVKMKAQTQRLHEYVDEAVDAVDQSVKRCERHEERVREVAEGLQGMKRAPSLPAPLNPTTAIAPPRTLLLRLVSPKTWFTPRQNQRTGALCRFLSTLRDPQPFLNPQLFDVDQFLRTRSRKPWRCQVVVGHVRPRAHIDSSAQGCNQGCAGAVGLVAHFCICILCLGSPSFIHTIRT